jgi:hypothetical protein
MPPTNFNSVSVVGGKDPVTHESKVGHAQDASNIAKVGLQSTTIFMPAITDQATLDAYAQALIQQQVRRRGG